MQPLNQKTDTEQSNKVNQARLDPATLTKAKASNINLPGWVTIALYVIVGFIAFLPGLFPTKTHLPTYYQMDSCIKTVGYKNDSKQVITKKTTIVQNWCALSSAANKFPAIHIIDPDPKKGLLYAAATSKFIWESAYLEMDSNAAAMNEDALKFVLAHEYQHINQRHTLYRGIFTTLLWASLVFSIVQMMAFSHATRINKVAAVFLLPIATYLIGFYSYSENELQADNYAFAHLKMLNFNPDKAASSFISVMEEFKIDTDAPNPFIPCIISGNTMRFSNCDPHPSRQQRATNLGIKSD